jgi:hypothetical protein
MGHKADIKLFRQAATAAGLSEEQRHDYSTEFHAGHRWDGDGLPDFAWFVADIGAMEGRAAPLRRIR